MIRTVNLEDVASEVTVGHVGSMKDEYLETGIPFLRSLNILPHRIDLSETKFVSLEFHAKLKKSALKPDDVVIVRTGKPGTCAVVPKSLPVSNCSDLVIVRCGPELRPRFLAYWVNTIASEHVASHIVGAVQQHFNVGAAKKMPIRLPTLEEQDDILGILGALDDKIEANRKASACLEEMARALYRSWFVAFDPVHAKSQNRPPAHMAPETAALFPDRLSENGLPEGWEMGSLGDLARNIREQVKPDGVDEKTPYIGLEHMPRRSLAVPSWDTATKVGSTKSAMKEGQFLFGKLRPYFHKVCLVPTDGICSTDILVVEAKEEHWRPFVATLISSDEMVEHADASSSGTRMPRANWKDMANFEAVLPTEKVARAFDQDVSPMHERILSIVAENQTLATLRDTLLPRLMSGTMGVKAAVAEVEVVL